MDAYAFAAAMLALAALIGVIVGSLAWAHGLGAKSRDGELLVARAERDSARAESEIRRASQGDGAAAAAVVVKAAGVAADVPDGRAGDELLWGGGDAGGPGGGPAPAAGSVA